MQREWEKGAMGHHAKIDFWYRGVDWSEYKHSFNELLLMKLPSDYLKLFDSLDGYEDLNNDVKSLRELMNDEKKIN
jgi:hypothetical protein